MISLLSNPPPHTYTYTEFGAPPSYDDVVPQPGPESSLQPTAPPLAHITAAEGNQPLPYYNETPTATVTVSPSPGPAGEYLAYCVPAVYWYLVSMP